MKSGSNNPAQSRLKSGFILARSFTFSAFAMFVDTLRLASDEADKFGCRFADW
jgi:transcriptional regulator GlxA family with amidase domain